MEKQNFNPSHSQCLLITAHNAPRPPGAHLSTAAAHDHPKQQQQPKVQSMNGQAHLIVILLLLLLFLSRRYFYYYWPRAEQGTTEQREAKPIVTLFVLISLFIMKLIFRSADEENGP